MANAIRFLLTIALGAGMILAGIIHFLKTRSYLRIVPEFLPMRMGIIQVSGVLELLAGVAIFIPAWRHGAAIFIMWMMIAFLPLHVWDVFRERPAMGSHVLACIRLPVQFLIIAWAWYVA